ncbi:MAG TPA: TonB-dependent receptor [Rhizomicrobium sp.]|nr:TonB-dependent receptor [Rhizomicrobium sp.]
MRGFRNRLLCGCAASASLLGVWSLPAKAQEAPQGQQIEQVIVTAQRRDENLQSVPITVNAFTSEKLQANNVISALDVGKLDTSVIVQAVDGNVLPFVRGVGTPLVTMGNESSIAVYLDGNYQTRLNPALLLLNNVDRIEILKGPQGTLFGRNASGGLINIITANPDPDEPMQAKATLGYGNYNTLYGTGYFADSIGSNFAFSLAGAYHNQQDGWGDNVTTGGKSWFGEEEAIRGKATYVVDEATRIRFSAFYARMHTDEGQQLQVQGQTQGWPAGSGLSGAVPELPFFDTRNDLSNAFVTEDSSASVSIEHDLSFATLIETAAWNQTSEDRPLDVDTTGLDAYDAEFQDYATQFTNELRLISNDADSPLQWTTGLYYYQTNQAYDPLELHGFSLGLPPDARLQIFSRLAVRSYAAYAQGTYKLAPRTDITFGVRYTEDDDSGSGYTQLALPNTAPIVLAHDAGSKSFAKWSWRAAVDYHFDDNAMAYASINRGFKSGTFNLVPFGSAGVKPEVLTAYEVGVKSEFWDNRARLNGSVFYYDYRDAQVNTVPAPGVLDIQNAPAAEVYGLDLDGEVVPFDGFTLKGGLSLLKARYTDFPDAAFFEPGGPPNYGLVGPFSRSADGNYLSRAPKVTFNVGGQYVVPLGSGSSLNLGANYAYTGAFFWDADNRVVQRAYGLLDAQLAYTFADGKYAVRLWGSNLTDEHYYANEFESAGPQGSVGAPAAPRTFGVMVDWAL